MKTLDEYLKLEKEIHAYFGYVEDWVKIPLQDTRECFWNLDGEGPGTILFAEKEEDLGSGQGFSEAIYTQRFLPKWVYRGAEFTLVCCDTQTDGNKFLRIFDNSKERKQP